MWPLELGLGTLNPCFVAWPLELGLGTRNPRFFAWPLELGLGTRNPCGPLRPDTGIVTGTEIITDRTTDDFASACVYMPACLHACVTKIIQNNYTQNHKIHEHNATPPPSACCFPCLQAIPWIVSTLQILIQKEDGTLTGNVPEMDLVIHQKWDPIMRQHADPTLPEPETEPFWRRFGKYVEHHKMECQPITAERLCR